MKSRLNSFTLRRSVSLLLLSLLATCCAKLEFTDDGLLIDTNLPESDSETSTADQGGTDTQDLTVDTSNPDTGSDNLAIDTDTQDLTVDTSNPDTGSDSLAIDTDTQDLTIDTDTPEDTGSGDVPCDQPGEVLDTEHNLCWEDPPGTAQFDLTAAEAYCASLTLDEATDWRVPTISELRTIIANCQVQEDGGACGVTDSCTQEITCEAGCTTCSSDTFTSPLLNHIPQSFKSSTILENDSNKSWVVNFDNAFISSASTVAARYIRCVRSSDQ